MIYHVMDLIDFEDVGLGIMEEEEAIGTRSSQICLQNYLLFLSFISDNTHKEFENKTIAKVLAKKLLSEANDLPNQMNLGNKKLFYKALSKNLGQENLMELTEFMIFNANINLNEEFCRFRHVIEDLLLFEEMGITINSTRKKALFAAKRMIEEDKATYQEIQRVALFHPDNFKTGTPIQLVQFATKKLVESNFLS
jgi:hypothetical protein